MSGTVVVSVWDEPASKSNQRRVVRTGRVCPACKRRSGPLRSMKSEKALSFVDSVKEQVAPLPELLEGELSATIHIWYRTQRPDLDESIILDALEGLVYKNDRQVREKHVYHAIDKEHPRVRVILTPRVALPSEEPFSWMRQLADAAPPPDSPGSPSGA